MKAKESRPRTDLTKRMEKVTLLEAKRGVWLSYVSCKEEAVEECLTKEEEGRRIALIQAPSVRENAPLKAKNGVDLRPK